MTPLATITRVGAALLALLHGTTALGTNYEHDGVTTYCWAVPRPTNMTKLTEVDRTTAFSTRVECPVALTLSLSPSDSVQAFERVNITWTAQVDFSGSNAVNATQLYYGQDMAGRTAQIVHSNVHSCVFGTGCDPFNDGKQLVDKTVNKIANFSDNEATFSDSLQFPEPGEYSVLAHIILPDFDESSRFDYAVYSKLTVVAAEVTTAAPVTEAPIEAPPTEAPTNEATNSSSEGSGLSVGVKIAIIIGAVVIAIALTVIVFFLCRRREHNVHSDTYVQAPGQDSGHADGRERTTKQWNAANTTDAFPSDSQAAWGTNDKNHRSSGNPGLPNYHDQYAAPRPSDARHSSERDHFPSSMQPPPHYNGQHPRKKRIDSDVEL